MRLFKITSIVLFGLFFSNTVFASWIPKTAVGYQISEEFGVGCESTFEFEKEETQLTNEYTGNSRFKSLKCSYYSGASFELPASNQNYIQGYEFQGDYLGSITYDQNLQVTDFDIEDVPTFEFSSTGAEDKFKIIKYAFALMLGIGSFEELGLEYTGSNINSFFFSNLVLEDLVVTELLTNFAEDLFIGFDAANSIDDFMYGDAREFSRDMASFHLYHFEKKMKGISAALMTSTNYVILY